jgi:hypothetical protein
MPVQLLPVIAAIGKDRCLIALHQGRGLDDLLHIGRRGPGRPNEGRSRIARHVQLVAELEPAALIVGAEARIRIDRAHRPLTHAGAPRRPPDEGGVDELPSLRNTPRASICRASHELRSHQRLAKAPDWWHGRGFDLPATARQSAETTADRPGLPPSPDPTDRTSAATATP